MMAKGYKLWNNSVKTASFKAKAFFMSAKASKIFYKKNLTHQLKHLKYI